MDVYTHICRKSREKPPLWTSSCVIMIFDDPKLFTVSMMFAPSNFYSTYLAISEWFFGSVSKVETRNILEQMLSQPTWWENLQFNSLVPSNSQTPFPPIPCILSDCHRSSIFKWSSWQRKATHLWCVVFWSAETKRKQQRNEGPKIKPENYEERVEILWCEIMWTCRTCLAKAGEQEKLLGTVTVLCDVELNQISTWHSWPKKSMEKHTK